MDFEDFSFLKKRDTSMDISNIIKRSYLSACVFFYTLKCSTIQVKKMASAFMVSYAQLYQVCQRFEELGAFKKTSKKANFYIAKDSFPESTWEAFRQDAILSIESNNPNKTNTNNNNTNNNNFSIYENKYYYYY